MKRRFWTVGLYGLFLIAGLAVGFAVPRVSAWFRPAYSEGDYSAYLRSANAKVVLYGTSWCPYCAKTRAYLASRNISYREMDIEKSPAAKQQFDQLGGGTVPKVLIGNRMIVGYVPSAFDAALEKIVAVK
jgi:glutaredoxin